MKRRASKTKTIRVNLEANINYLTLNVERHLEKSLKRKRLQLIKTMIHGLAEGNSIKAN